ncbi:MAG: precorrin-6y C5,15-methyltransferase (decarboxylating) subunit CbiE [Desulfovibrionaceae bacterium]
MLGHNPIHVIGMRPGSLELGPREWSILERSQVIAGGKRLLAACALASTPERPIRPEKQIPITGSLDAVIRLIDRHKDKRVAVLADGDPLFFGFGRKLVDDLGADRVIIHPNVTTLQVAAARLRIPWNSIETVSLHGRDDFTPFYAAISRADRVAVYTGPDNGPAALAEALLNRGADGFTMTVLEDLDTPQERIRRLTPEQTWDAEFSPLNLVIIERSHPPEIPLHLGVPDQLYMHEKGLITKQAVRAAGLGMLGVAQGHTVWDLGSGCGSVAIEASHLAAHGLVYAVEKNRRRAGMIRENVRRFGAWLVEVVRGEAPECLEKLPDPDRIFIGGGLGPESGDGQQLLDVACRRLKRGGRIVIHCILLESLLRAKARFEEQKWPFGATQIMASTTDPLAGDLRFKAHNPVFILWAEKP